MAKGILADANAIGQVEYLVRQIQRPAWTDFWKYLDLSLKSFQDVGLSAVSFDVGQNDALQFAGDQARSYSLAFVQSIDVAAMDLFVDGRMQTLRRTYADYYDLFTVGLVTRYIAWKLGKSAYARPIRAESISVPGAGYS